MKKILIIDDDIDIGNMLEETLIKEGYETSRAYSGTEAILLLEHAKPDLVLLDLMLPGLNGEEVLPKIKNIPVIIISAKIDIDNKVNLLLNGAVDYMTKPFGVLELQARVRSLLRRHAPKAAPIIESQTLKIDKQTRTVMHNGQVMELTNKEYQLLLYLVENHTRVVERDEILNHIWGYDFIGESRVLDVHIRALRAKLDDDGSKYIKTIRGVGYRYVEEVK